MTNQRTKNTFLNMVAAFSNQLIILVLGFVSRTVFIYSLGIDYLGMNGLFSDVMSMLSIADLGLGTAMVYSFYKPLAENDQDKITTLIQFYKKIYNRIAIVITIIGLCITPFIRYIVNTDQKIPLIHVYYLFALANVVISYLYVYKSSIILANQQGYIVTKISTRIRIVATIIQTISLVVLHSYLLYLLIGVISVLFNNIIVSKKASELFPYIENKSVPSDIDRGSIFANIKAVFLYKISSVFLIATDNIIISIIISAAAVGYYSNYSLLQNKITGFVQIIFVSITASIGNIIATEGTEKRHKVFQSMQSVSFILCGFIVISYGIMVNDVIRTWLGSEFLFDNIVVFMISLNMYLLYILQPLWSFREATGLYQKTKYVMVLAAIINVVLSIILGKLMGVSGVFLASVISRVVTYFWYEPFLLFREYFNQSAIKYYRSLGVHFVISLIIYVVFFVTFTKWEIHTVQELLIKLCVVAVSTLCIYLIIYSRTEGFKLMKEKAVYLFTNLIKPRMKKNKSH